MSRSFGARPRVLVVDDDRDCRELLHDALDSEGFDVVTAKNGAEALDVAHQQTPGVILLDLMMPVLDGFGFRERQRADMHIAQIPVVCISGRHNARAAAEQLGAVACVEKPIRFDDLFDAIRRALTATGDK
jgi:two-component system, chemotaxis family, chemotaxis protein CheY